MYQTYLFDWDGCLVDTLSIWLRVHREIFAHAGVPFPDKQDFEKILADISYEAGIQARFPEYVAAKYKQLEVEMKKEVQFNPGAEALLKRLKSEGKQIGLVTSSHRNVVEAVLRRHKMQHSFDVMMCAEDTKRHKPDPQPILKAIEQLDADPHTTVMVGDTYYDINAGKAARIDTILYHNPGMHDQYYDLSDEVQHNPPTHIVASLPEVLHL